MEARIQQELTDIIAALTELTGLPSRWSGVVELVPGAEFKGKKPFRCDILLDAALADSSERWMTLIHEALHSFSAGYIREDYQSLQGWEEGIVEQLQRMLREAVLLRLNVNVPRETLVRLDSEHGYNRFIAALEAIRQSLSSTQNDFYLPLLSVAIKDRPGYVYSLSHRLSSVQRQAFTAVFSSAGASLRTRRR